MSASRRRKSQAQAPPRNAAATRGRWLIVGGALAAAALVAAVFVVNRERVPPAPPIVAVVQDFGDLEDGRTLGKSDAPVTLDLWADFQCPACRFFALQMTPMLVQNYLKSGKARLRFHDMATLGRESGPAALAARCAGRQKKFWPYHDLLFRNQKPENSGGFSQDMLRLFAGTLGLDTAAFEACLADSSVQNEVRAETRQAFLAQVRETPTLRVNGAPVASISDWTVISAAIESALKDASVAAPR